MKKYNTLGELFIDYRSFNNISQLDFSQNVNVDVRTIQRWESNVTLVKSDKEEDIVLETLLPYQLIRNLNASVPIPTFYDFRIRKYSLTKLTNDLPDASWFKAQMDISTKRIRRIDFDFDIKYISRFIDSQHRDNHFVDRELIKEAVRILPELNLVLTDDSGYYSGHCIVLPLKESVYKRLRNREMKKEQLRAVDLINYKQLERPIFFNYDITADCNDNIFYLVCEFFRFFRDYKNKDYLFCSYTERYDSQKFAQQLGIKVVWEDKELQEKLGLDVPPRFTEGNYNNFFSNSLGD